MRRGRPRRPGGFRDSRTIQPATTHEHLNVGLSRAVRNDRHMAARITPRGDLVKTLEQTAPSSAVVGALHERIAAREARIGLIGLGYAGLPLAVAFAEAGYSVAGIDLAADRVDALNAGRSYVGDVSGTRLAPIVASKRLIASTDYASLANADAVTICVPTPLTRDKAPDPSAIAGATRSLAPWLRPGQLIVLESTSYPGTTQELVQPIIEEQGFTIGKDIFLAFAPERVNPGDERFGTRNTPKLIGGVTPACGELAAALYETIVDDVVPVSSPRIAEMAKLMENTFRQINVAFANEMALICEHLGIDVWEVIDAAATKPFGYMPFYPGPGLGGPCIPIVPHYLAWKLKQTGHDARFIGLSEEINGAMPGHLVNLAAAALHDMGKALRGADILMLGVTYKPNVADVRESPAAISLAGLLNAGANARYHDPFVPWITVAGQTLESVPLDAATLQQVDCVVIATNHRLFDWDWVVENARLVVDARNATKNVPPEVRQRGARIVKLGAPRTADRNEP